MKRITQSLLTRYRREIATGCAVFASLLIVGRLVPLGTHEVIIASRDLPIGTQISASDLGTVNSRGWPNEIRSLEEVIGRSLNHSIPAGAMVATSDLVGAQLPSDDRLQISIPTSAADAFLIANGMHVDIYSPLGLVCADAVIVSTSTNQKSGLFASSSQSSAVVAIAPADVQALAAAKDQSPLTLALRPTS